MEYEDTFAIYGVLARRDSQSRPRLNFTQVLWPYPGVGMDWSAQFSREMHTLAVNILAQFVPPQLNLVANGEADEQLLRLAEAFASELLASMPAAGGRIPQEIVVEWLGDRL